MMMVAMRDEGDGRRGGGRWKGERQRGKDVQTQVKRARGRSVVKEERWTLSWRLRSKGKLQTGPVHVL